MPPCRVPHSPSLYAKVGFELVGVMRAYERTADGIRADGPPVDMLDSDRCIPEARLGPEWSKLSGGRHATTARGSACSS